MVRKLLAVSSLLLASILAQARPAQACSWSPPPASAFPGAGATGISPRTSIFVRGGRELPQALVLEANGQPVPITATESLGAGDRSGPWVKLDADLAPLTTYTLRGQDQGAPVELTRFTTAAAPGATPGTAPRLQKLQLYRVQYPRNLVGAGSCVQAEAEGFIDLTYQPGTVPETPAGEVFHVATLTRKAGGPAQRHVLVGAEPVKLTLFTPSIADPAVQLPDPAYSLWKPQLDAGDELCVTLTVHGRNDRAFAPMTSEPICARVTALQFPGWPDATAPEEGGGCSVGHGAPPGGLTLVLLLALIPLRLRRRQ
jgi:MYXO-CTERM domain-containing protein